MTSVLKACKRTRRCVRNGASSLPPRERWLWRGRPRRGMPWRWRLEHGVAPRCRRLAQAPTASDAVGIMASYTIVLPLFSCRHPDIMAPMWLPFRDRAVWLASVHSCHPGNVWSTCSWIPQLAPSAPASGLVTNCISCSH